MPKPDLHVVSEGNPNIVEVLETALEKARAGEFDSVAVVAVCKENAGTWHGFSFPIRAFTTLGALEWVKSKVLDIINCPNCGED